MLDAQMVERVARRMGPLDFDHLPRETQLYWLMKAEAAIGALREMSGRMLNAATFAQREFYREEPFPDDKEAKALYRRKIFERGWRAAIDAALTWKAPTESNLVKTLTADPAFRPWASLVQDDPASQA